jgi:hypothetical protein
VVGMAGGDVTDQCAARLFFERVEAARYCVR